MCAIGRAERTHRERHDVHRAAAHAAVEQAVQRRAHLLRVRPSCWSGRRRPSLLTADERAVLDARHVRRIGPTPDSEFGALGGIELRAACRRRPSARTGGRIPSWLPSHQTMRVGLGQRGDVLDPVEKLSMPDIRAAHRSRRRCCVRLLRADSSSCLRSLKDENGWRSSTLPCERRIQRNSGDTFTTLGGSGHAKRRVRRGPVLRKTGMA